jgi:hypothetical protein
MKTIYKYTLKAVDDQLIKIPTGAEILTVQTQKGNAMLWAAVDPELPVENRHIRIRRTGDRLTDDLVYISTYQMKNGELVFHAFEVVNK